MFREKLTAFELIRFIGAVELSVAFAFNIDAAAVMATELIG
jgi:hypothetical protein